jgi:hypothetical protein
VVEVFDALVVAGIGCVLAHFLPKRPVIISDAKIAAGFAFA